MYKVIKYEFGMKDVRWFCAFERLMNFSMNDFYLKIIKFQHHACMQVSRFSIKILQKLLFRGTPFPISHSFVDSLTRWLIIIISFKQKFHFFNVQVVSYVLLYVRTIYFELNNNNYCRGFNHKQTFMTFGRCSYYSPQVCELFCLARKTEKFCACQRTVERWKLEGVKALQKYSLLFRIWILRSVDFILSLCCVIWNYS